VSDTIRGDARKKEISRRNIAILVTIGVVAASLGAASFFYITYMAERVRAQAIANSQYNAEVKADDLASIAEEQIESVRSNLVLISRAKWVQEQDVQSSVPLFSTAQDLTKRFTESYFWLDSDGKLLWSSSSSSEAVYQLPPGAEASQRSYYSVPLLTKKFHITEVIQSPDGQPRIVFANPILNAQDSSFKGVIGAASSLNQVGNVLTALLARTQSTVILMATDGKILYSQDESMIGLDVTDERFQSSLPETARSGVISFMRKSLDDSVGGDRAGGSSNFQNLAAGQSATLAYQPVIVDNRAVAAVFVVAPHTFATDTFVQLENLRILAVVLITGIGAVAFGLAAAFTRWNKKLELLVLKRTSELASRTRELEDSNRGLSQAHEKLKVHDKLQREFVNIAAHELRTPIQPLLGAAEIMEMQCADKAKIEVSKAELQLIIRNAKRLERLSSDILDLSRIDSGALKLTNEDFSLSYIIADAIKDARLRSQMESENVEMTYFADDIFVRGDRAKISQVVSNLLTNAIKFTRNGTITVSTQRDVGSNTAVVTVKDTGTGIDAEVLPKIFERFVTKSEHGTGIGLYISKKIVEAHGGRIWGENRSDGVKGATFGFTLPLSPLDKSEVKEPKPESSAAQTAN
jgi:signal transduction histidine kinase